MKKSFMILAASSMLLFAACNKDKEENSAYTINGDQITFGVGMDSDQIDGKQSFNGEYRKIFFTTGDRMIINYDGATVYPVASDLYPGSTNAFSPVARVTTGVSADGSYDFMYPATDFRIDMNGDFHSYFPQRILALSGSAVNNDFSQIDSARRPLWPMYAGIEDINEFTGRSVLMRNACSWLSPSFIYGPAWANFVFKPITGLTYGTNDANGVRIGCPTMVANNGLIISDCKLWGHAHLDYSNKIAPVMVMDDLTRGTTDTVVYIAPQNALIVESNSGQTSNEIMSVAGIIPVAPMQWYGAKRFQVVICFTINLPIVIDGVTVETPVYMAFVSNTKEVNGVIERNNRYMLETNFQTIDEDEGDVTYMPGEDIHTAEAYAAAVLRGNGAEIQLANGLLYLSTDAVNANAWVRTNVLHM